jgi:predicted phage tail protein
MVSPTLSNLTKYYWRVNATNSEGTIAYTTDSFTTIIAAPAQPTLASPEDGVTNQDVNLTLSWNAAARASTYHLQVSKISDYSTTVYNDSTLTGLSQAMSGLDKETTYYWHVRAKNAGGVSAWSAGRGFVTVPNAPPPQPLPEKIMRSKLLLLYNGSNGY